ncbi:hypothetical protein V2J09_016944 [Rumex salicifolius]
MGAIKNRSAKKKAKTRQSIEGPSFATVSNTHNEATDDETLEEILQGKRQEIRNKTTRKKEEKKKEQEKERRKDKIEVSKKKKQEEKKEKEKKTGKKGGKKEENDQEKLPKEGTNTGTRALRQQYKTLFAVIYMFLCGHFEQATPLLLMIAVNVSGFCSYPFGHSSHEFSWPIASLEHCTSLLKLQVYDCGKLSKLPVGVQALKDLQELTIAGCSVLTKR